MTDPNDWNALGQMGPSELVDASLELHWATQLLAAAGQNFAEPCLDDSHRAVTWSNLVDGFLGREFHPGYPFRLGLSVEAFELRLLDRTDAVLGSMELGGATLEDAYAWLRTGLSQYMGGTGPTIDRPEFEIPEHAVGSGAPFSRDAAEARQALAALYRSASAVLEDVARSGPSGSPVRCWPHHFDVATLLTVRDAWDPEPARTIGVGMAPMGGGYGTWYWYVTPWPYPEAPTLPALDGPAEWHTEGWVGAVLQGSHVVDRRPEERESAVRTFIEGAVQAATQALTD